MLIRCPECKKQISDTADICINCGYKLKQKKHFYDTKFAKAIRPFIIAFLIFFIPLYFLSFINNKQHFDETMSYYYHNISSYNCYQYAQSSGISYDYLYECNINIQNHKQTDCFQCKKEGALGINRISGCVLKAETTCNDYIVDWDEK